MVGKSLGIPKFSVRRSLFVIEHRSSPLRPAVPLRSRGTNSMGFFSKSIFQSALLAFLGYFVMALKEQLLRCTLSDIATAKFSLSHTSASAADPNHGAVPQGSPLPGRDQPLPGRDRPLPMAASHTMRQAYSKGCPLTMLWHRNN